MGMPRRILVALFAVLLTSGCAWTTDSVPIQRQAVPVARVPGATGISVAVDAADSRQEREVSHKKNGYGMRGADIVAANDIVREIRDGVRDILTGQGFGEGPDAAVRIDVSRFYNTFDTGFWSATANAQATASLTVTAADGRSLYARVYTVTHQMPNVQIMTGDNAATALRAAMQALLRQIADDPQLPAALMRARPGDRRSPARGRAGA